MSLPASIAKQSLIIVAGEPKFTAKVGRKKVATPFSVKRGETTVAYTHEQLKALIVAHAAKAQCQYPAADNQIRDKSVNFILPRDRKDLNQRGSGAGILVATEALGDMHLDIVKLVALFYGRYVGVSRKAPDIKAPLTAITVDGMPTLDQLDAGNAGKAGGVVLSLGINVRINADEKQRVHFERMNEETEKVELLRWREAENLFRGRGADESFNSYAGLMVKHLEGLGFQRVVEIIRRTDLQCLSEAYILRNSGVHIGVRDAKDPRDVTWVGFLPLATLSEMVVSIACQLPVVSSNQSNTERRPAFVRTPAPAAAPASLSVSDATDIKF